MASMWALRRQMVGVIFFSVIVLGISGYIFYTLYPKYSCFDRVKNGQEEEVDCGGPQCVSCVGETRQPRIFWKRFLPVRSGVYDGAALIENQNLKLGTRRMDFMFTLYDGAGVMLDQKTGSTYVYPGEQTLLYVPNLEAGNREPAQIELKIDQIPWANMAPQSGINIDIVRKSFENEPHPIVSVTVKNKSLFEEKGLEFYVLLERADGNTYAASRTITEGFIGGEERQILFTWPTSSFENPTNIRVLYRRVLE